MDQPQIYKVIHFAQDCLGRIECAVGNATYLNDEMAVATALKRANTRVFLYPQNIEVTEAKLELICQKQS